MTGVQLNTEHMPITYNTKTFSMYFCMKQVAERQVCECSEHGYLVIETGSIKRGSECDWLRHTEDLLTVLEDTAGCCGCEAEQRDFGELPLQDAQELIIYTKYTQISLMTFTSSAKHILKQTRILNSNSALSLKLSTYITENSEAQTF